MGIVDLPRAGSETLNHTAMHMRDKHGHDFRYLRGEFRRLTSGAHRGHTLRSSSREGLSLPLLDLFPDVHVGVVLGGRGDLVPLEDQLARLER